MSGKLNKFVADPILTILIGTNIAIFVILLAGGRGAADFISTYLSLSQQPQDIIYRPWTLITYSIVQADIIQLLFNLLWLYCFGRLLLMRVSRFDILLLYIGGAVCGGLTFILSDRLFGLNIGGNLIGSSAAVISIATATAMMMPDLRIYLPLFGPTKTKWIVMLAVIFFCIGLSTPNAGGNLAHLGGVLSGLIGAIVISRKRKSDTMSETDEYNSLVSKIRGSGYDALSAKEKHKFFELSNKR